MAIAGKGAQIFVKASSSTPSTSDEPSGIKKFNGSMKVDLGDATDFKNNSGAKARIPLLFDASPTFSGDYLSTDTVQQLIRSSFLAGTELWVTIYVDPTQSSPNRGFQYPVFIETCEVDDQVDGVAQMNVTTQLTAPIVAV
jgi:hypothetical protein